MPSRNETRNRTALLGVEWLALFVVIPFVAYFDWIVASKFAIFAAPVLYALVVSWRQRPQLRPVPPLQSDRSLDDARAKPAQPRFPRTLLLRTSGGVSAVFLFAYLRHPEHFLDLPKNRTGLWLLICAFYPWVSAWPQEFLYRRFYFERYEKLFGNPTLLILSNLLCFALLHLMYDNVIAIGMTLLGGALFIHTYLTTRSLRWAALEHAVYGLAVFTSGLGQFFYEPIAR